MIGANWTPGYVDPGSDGGLEEDLVRRRYRGLMVDDGEEYDSDDE
jgi:Niemann-Pick C1 protein